MPAACYGSSHMKGGRRQQWRIAHPQLQLELFVCAVPPTAVGPAGPAVGTRVALRQQSRHAVTSSSLSTPAASTRCRSREVDAVLNTIFLYVLVLCICAGPLCLARQLPAGWVSPCTPCAWQHWAGCWVCRIQGSATAHHCCAFVVYDTTGAQRLFLLLANLSQVGMATRGKPSMCVSCLAYFSVCVPHIVGCAHQDRLQERAPLMVMRFCGGVEDRRCIGGVSLRWCVCVLWCAGSSV